MKKTALNLNENITCVLCYVLGWISGLVIVLMEKENKLVRFHAMQSIVFSLAVTLLTIIIGSFLRFAIGLIPIINFIVMIVWVFLMIKAYKGESFKLPILGDYAEKWVEKIKL